MKYLTDTHLNREILTAYLTLTTKCWHTFDFTTNSLLPGLRIMFFISNADEKSPFGVLDIFLYFP